MPQSQTAALPRHQEEEETDKTKQAQTEQTHEKHQDQHLPPPTQDQKLQVHFEQNKLVNTLSDDIFFWSSTVVLPFRSAQ